MVRVSKKFLPLILLVGLVGCKDNQPTPTPNPPKKPGVAITFKGIEIPTAMVDDLIPYLQTYRKSESLVSIKRYILLEHAIQLAWSLSHREKEFAAAKAKADKWLTDLKSGKVKLTELIHRQTKEFSGGEAGVDATKPITLGRSSIPLAMAKVAFTGPKGEFLGPIRNPLGWSIIRVSGYKRGVVRDHDLVTFHQITALAGGLTHSTKLKEFQYSLTRARGAVEIIDPDYHDVVPLYLKK